MFERFTYRTRRVLNYANNEASKAGSKLILSEHFLLGIILEGGGVAFRVLENLLDKETLIKELRKKIDSEKKEGKYFEKVPISPEVYQVAKYGIEEASLLISSSVGTEHLLLGLFRLKSGILYEALTKKDLTLETLRQKIKEFSELKLQEEMEISKNENNVDVNSLQLDPFVRGELERMRKSLITFVERLNRILEE